MKKKNVGVKEPPRVVAPRVADTIAAGYGKDWNDDVGSLVVAQLQAVDTEAQEPGLASDARQGVPDDFDRIGEDVQSIKARLAELEGIVDRGQAGFIESGMALIQIHDGGLYKYAACMAGAKRDTFEGYVERRFGITRQYAYEIMDAAKVSTIVDIRNASQGRALAPLMKRLGEGAAREAFGRAKESADASGGEVTEAALAAVVRGMMPARKKARTPKTPHRTTLAAWVRGKGTGAPENHFAALAVKDIRSAIERLERTMEYPKQVEALKAVLADVLARLASNEAALKVS